MSLALVLVCGTFPSPLWAGQAGTKEDHDGRRDTATPMRYLVEIFDENNSFDHYFDTYPLATHPGGEPAFHAADDTPRINGLNGRKLLRLVP